jgi:ABC-type multidrug transport system permease subunit
MIHGMLAVYTREMMILRRRLTRQIPSWSVSPLLYLVAFGYAMGRHVAVDGHTYMEFLLPGLMAMASMTQAFGISSEINIARFYWHIFEEIQAAPVSDTAYVGGEVLAGMTRGFLAVCIILIFGRLFGVSQCYPPLLFVAILMNSFVFASMAVGIAMLVKSHADQSLVTNFVITPMAFLGGTFFPLKSLPLWAQKALYFLPLTHASKAIRAASFGHPPEALSYVVLAGVGSVFFTLAVYFVRKSKD